MDARQRTTVSVRQLGEEREPVVVIDNFSGMPGQLLETAREARFAPADAFYPGVRAPLDPSYLDRQRGLMIEVMRRVFGFRNEMHVLNASYSIVSSPPDNLEPPQCIPHYDDASGNIIAVMHYLQGRETGGTAFYRHNRTGFECVTPEREAAFHSAKTRDHTEFGAMTGYHYGDSEAYTMIGEVEAEPDRLVMYRGRLLHSGVIPGDRPLSDDPETGRLTINMFLSAS
ncbi:hypothetical protein GRI38_07730 [Altererythrobacter aurantiacus]|uniref:Uncharacterized protein n=1 Tax=Parapontixanthobacter aurantiacus TaxID=1463599 RepID=A0A844ZBK3_9SPHN|nr:DUF6445 family protein [Parapontixanthobacter aurantiacus]MXO85921.1 hypothetical protein [Parapontixanthobacter aurantiacus]